MTAVLATESDASTALAATRLIDLAPISQKLWHGNPIRWTRAILAEAETNYRRFLALHLMHPTESLVPNELLDEYWHQHILDTRKYAADCESVFGFFLHHDPYFGLGSEEERQRNLEAFATTQSLWEEAFGVPLLGEPNPCSTTDCR